MKYLTIVLILFFSQISLANHEGYDALEENGQPQHLEYGACTPEASSTCFLLGKRGSRAYDCIANKREHFSCWKVATRRIKVMMNTNGCSSLTPKLNELIENGDVETLNNALELKMMGNIDSALRIFGDLEECE
ncbi:MAG: hypothetical protein HON90_11950 [Halobacteriovoraceae bacterium]|jgi:hypothetical protein|nr:hypothetical protein [Halobacteriovoraceae bacterium]